MDNFILEVALRRLHFNDLIKALFEICHTGISVDVGFDCLKDLPVPADLEGRARERFPAFLVVLVYLDAGSGAFWKVRVTSRVLSHENVWMSEPSVM